MMPSATETYLLLFKGIRVDLAEIIMQCPLGTKK